MNSRNGSDHFQNCLQKHNQTCTKFVLKGYVKLRCVKEKEKIFSEIMRNSSQV